jgi:hypothetical protein
MVKMKIILVHMDGEINVLAMDFQQMTKGKIL